MHKNSEILRNINVGKPNIIAITHPHCGSWALLGGLQVVMYQLLGVG